ncbi:hypothetical protein MELB17_09288 [Marinobacter sp. ELB17]|nr:hypothetical protein MELB17_09288 [Marinobacter sp. ELB17]
MACPCGNHILKHRLARQSIGVTVYELDFRECDSCGRVGFERLTKTGELVGEGPRARGQYQALQDNRALPWEPSVSKSAYHPYKLWFTPNRQAVHVCLLKLDSKAVAICPDYRLLIEGDDYLQTSFELTRQVIGVLKLDAGTRMAVTDSPPFDLTWGTKPAIRFPQLRSEPPFEPPAENLLPESPASKMPALAPPAFKPPQTVKPEPQIDTATVNPIPAPMAAGQLALF